MADKKKATTLRPTIVAMPAARRKAAPTKPAAAPEPAGARSPTAIIGVERKRLEVSSAELRALSPGVSDAVAAAARDLLKSFVSDKITERKAVLWGHAAQQAYGAYVTETLALSQSESLRRAERHLNRMIDILKSVDVMAAAGHGGAGLGEFFKTVNARIDTPSELETARLELDELMERLNAALEDLLTLKEKLDGHACRQEELTVDIEAAALAALYLSQFLRQKAPAIAERFVTRSMSLTQTVAQIHGGSAVQDQQVEHPMRVVEAIQHVVLVALPSLLASFAAVASSQNRRTAMSLTEASEINDQLRDILNRTRI